MERYIVYHTFPHRTCRLSHKWRSIIYAYRTNRASSGDVYELRTDGVIIRIYFIRSTLALLFYFS